MSIVHRPDRRLKCSSCRFLFILCLMLNKSAVYSTVVAICLPLGYYVYKRFTGNAKFIEFGQEIEPLRVTVDIIKNGYKDRPYMPFRYPYNQTMALVKMDMNYWAILDHEYFKFMEVKRTIFEGYDEEKLKKHPYYKRLYDFKSNEVFSELCQFVVNHYTHRFPNLFTKKGQIIHNHLLDEQYDLDTMDPYLVVTRISMEDFYVVSNNQCIGVSVAFGGGGFPIAPIVGKSMDFIHKPVPYYETKLKKSMNKWFDKFKDPVERSSWHIVWDDDLTCSELYSKHRELDETSYQQYITQLPFEKFDVRVERQTLIKLPKTGAIIFANHPIYLNIEKEIMPAPYAASIVLKTMYEAPEDIIKYKHFEAIRDHIAPEIKERNQYPEENPRTQNCYPFAHWMPDSWTLEDGFVQLR